MKKLLAMITALAIAFCAVPVNAEAEDVIRIACVGDSITEGSGTGAECSYPAQLQEMLGDGYEVMNFGCSSAAAMRDGALFSYWGVSQYSASLASEPDIVIIMLGSNDALAENRTKAEDHFKEHYTDLINTYIELESSPEIWLATSPETTEEPRKTNTDEVILPTQLEIAEKLNINLVDVNTLTKAFVDRFADGVHPDTSGYYLLAQIFYEEVFGGAVYDVEVKAEAGTEISVGGYSAEVLSNGSVTVPVAAGERTIVANRMGYSAGIKTVEVTGDMTVDMTDAEYTANLAYNADLIEEKGGRNYYSQSQALDKINDGDLHTGWQLTGEELKNGSAIQNVWVGYDFGTVIAFDQVVIWWEEGSRCPLSGYSLSFSADGESWTDIDFTVKSSNAVDTCSFDAVSARYVRIVCEKASSKYFPKIFEAEVYNASGAVPQLPAFIKGDVNGDGSINSTDFMQVRRHFLGLYEMTDTQKTAADVNSDGSINSTDFTQIRRHFLGLFDLSK